jgi:hypothetical protein
LIGPIGYDVRELHFLPYYARDLRGLRVRSGSCPLSALSEQARRAGYILLYLQGRPRAGDGIWSAAGQVRNVGNNILL